MYLLLSFQKKLLTYPYLMSFQIDEDVKTKIPLDVHPKILLSSSFCLHNNRMWKQNSNKIFLLYYKFSSMNYNHSVIPYAFFCLVRLCVYFFKSISMPLTCLYILIFVYTYYISTLFLCQYTSKDKKLLPKWCFLRPASTCV